MARDPGSTWAPLPEAGAPDGYRKTQLIFHATGGAGSARAIRDNWFGRADVVVESTFIVGKSKSDPTLQMMDSTDNADANYTANQRAISVEVVCTGSEPYTDWQVAECIRIGRWAAAHHPISKRICPAHDQSGFGWHVMFGAPGPWTPAVGKVCPGAPAVAQLKTLIFPAIFADTDPTPEDDMFSDADRELLKTIEGKLTDPNINGGTLPTAVRQVHAGLVVTKYERPGPSPDGDELKAASALGILRYGEAYTRRALLELVGLRAAFDKLADAYAQGRDVDADEIKTAVKEAMSEGVIKVDVSVIDRDDEPTAEQPPPAA